MTLVEQLIESTRVGFVVAGGDRQVVYANPAARKLLRAGDELRVVPADLAGLGLDCQTQPLPEGRQLYSLRSQQDTPVFHLEWRLETATERIRELEEELARQPVAAAEPDQDVAHLQGELRQARLQASWARQLEENLATQQQQLGRVRSELKICQMQRTLVEERERTLRAEAGQLRAALEELPTRAEVDQLRQRAERAELRLKLLEDMGELESLLELSENRADEALRRAQAAEEELSVRRAELARLTGALQNQGHLAEQVQEMEVLLEDAERRAEESELQAVKIGSSMREFVRSAEQRALAAEKKLRQFVAGRLDGEGLSYLRDLEIQLLGEQKVRSDLEGRVATLQARLKVVSRGQ